MFNALFYQPLYNALVVLIDYLPKASAGMAVILLTLIVKLVLFPLSKSSVKTQILLKKYEPDIENIKKATPDKQQQSLKIMGFYREKGINPFSGFFLLLIQIPIIIALYLVFRKGLPTVDPAMLYSFVTMPGKVDMLFLGIVDLAKNSWVLAFLAGLSGYFQTKFSMPPLAPRSANPSFKEDLGRSMHIQMKYVMPFVIFFIAYGISGAVALYWTVSNLFTILQEIIIRKSLRK